MSLRSDDRGLESLPLKLMIVAVVASLSIVPAAESLNSLRSRDFINRIDLMLDEIISTAQQLAIGGPGGARTVKLDFTSDGRLAFEHLIIGDREGGPNMSSAVLRLTNGAVALRTCADPPVWMRTIEGQGLIVESSISELRMASQMDGRVVFVLLELA